MIFLLNDSTRHHHIQMQNESNSACSLLTSWYFCNFAAKCATIHHQTFQQDEESDIVIIPIGAAVMHRP